MITPAPQPYFVLIFPIAFIILMAIGYYKTGKFLELLQCDSLRKFGNSHTRKIFKDFLIFFNIKKADGKVQNENIDSLALHQDMDSMIFQQRYHAYHNTLVKDVADFWLTNQKLRLGMSYQFVLPFMVNNVMEDLSDIPNIDKFESEIYHSVKLIISQYDWS